MKKLQYWKTLILIPSQNQQHPFQITYSKVINMKAIDIEKIVIARCFLGLHRFKLGSIQASTIHASYGIIGSMQKKLPLDLDLPSTPFFSSSKPSAPMMFAFQLMGNHLTLMKRTTCWSMWMWKRKSALDCHLCLFSPPTNFQLVCLSSTT